MKLKYFMRGLGTGIIFTTMVLAISYQNRPKQELTDAQIVERAQQLGMISQEEQDKKMDKSLDHIEAETEKETQQPSGSPAATAKASVKPTETAKTTATPVSSKTPAPKATTKATPTPMPTTKPTKKPAVAPTSKQTKQATSIQKAMTVPVRIESGMGSGEVASYFKRAGAIQNATKFDQYLCQHGYASKIKTGSYQISTDASYYEIAKMITK